MALLFKADGGFVWLIVGIFWVVAQLAGAAAKKQPLRPPVSDDDPGETPVDPFAELLRKMAGTQTFEVPTPEYNNEQEYEEEQEEALAKTERMPDIEPLRREPPSPIETFSKIEDVDIRPTMRAFRNTLPAMKLPAMTLRFQPLEKSSGKVPMLGKILNPADKTSLRRAILGKIIFSPPKALEKI